MRHFPTLFLLSVLTFFFSPAAGGPPPAKKAPLPFPSSSTAPADFPLIDPETGAEIPEWQIICGTKNDRGRASLEKHLQLNRLARLLPTTFSSMDVGSIAVIEDDGSIIVDQDSDGDLEQDDVALAQRFYLTHADSFDFIGMFTNFDYDIFNGGATAYHAGVRNEVSGIGNSIYDNSAVYGSAGRLRSFLNMNTLHIYPASPITRLFGNNDNSLSLMGQEAGHRWGAFVQFDSDPGPGVSASNNLLGRGLAHWSFFFNTGNPYPGASSLEGNGINDNGGSSFTTTLPTDAYCDLDLYLMGLKDSSEVPSFWYVASPFNTGGRTASSAPAVGVTFNGTKTFVNVKDVAEVEGLRTPDTSGSQKQFRMAWVLLVKNGTLPTGWEIARLDSFRTQWETYYDSATGHRGQMVSDLGNGNPLTIASSSLAAASQGGSYRDQVFAVGGTRPYNWFITSGSLPTGLSLSNTTGVISGTPTGAAGIYAFSVEVTDAASGLQSKSFTISVYPAGSAQVVINEIELGIQDALELYNTNTGTVAQDISNWTVECRAGASLTTLTIPSGTILPPGQHMILREAVGGRVGWEFFFGQSIPWANNSSGSCALKNSSGSGIDFVRWGSSAQAPPAGTFWFTPNAPLPPTGSYNLGRNIMSADSDSGSDWSLQNGTLGLPNNGQLPSLLGQSSTLGNSQIQATLTNFANVGRQGTAPGLSYVSEGISYLYDASLMVAALRDGGDTTLYRSMFSHTRLLPTSVLTLDSVSDPRAKHAFSSQLSSDGRLEVQTDFMLPKPADSAQFLIAQYKLTNVGSGSLNDCLIGMAADFDIQGSVNRGGFDSVRNLVFQQSTADTNRFAGIVYLSPASAHSGQVLDNPTFLYPAGGWLDRQYYRQMAPAGFRPPTADSTDLSTAVVGPKKTLLPGECGVAAFALVVSRTGRADFLSSAEKARVFFTAPNQFAPVLASVGSITVEEESTAVTGLSAGDADCTFPALTAGGLPAYASLVDSGNGRGSLTFSPGIGDFGSDTFLVIASDGLFADSQQVVVNVQSGAPVKGDLNGDRQLTASDAVLMLNCVFLGLDPPVGGAACDIDCSGTATATDVVILLNMIFLGASPPC